MTSRVVILRGATGAILGLLLSLTVGAAIPAGNAASGKTLFIREGCASCHGTSGAGALVSAPEIAPDPAPWSAFIRQLRRPLNSGRYGTLGMPRFGNAILTEAQAADIYAYLLSIKSGSPASQIPLLRR